MSIKIRSSIRFQTIHLIRVDSAIRSSPSLVRGKNIRFDFHHISEKHKYFFQLNLSNIGDPVFVTISQMVESKV